MGDKLLDLGLGASFLQLGNQLLGVFLGDSFLQGLGAVVNQILSVLQAQAGSSTDNLDNAQLGSASVLQDDVELGLLFDFLSSSGSSNSSGSGITPEVRAAMAEKKAAAAAAKAAASAK